MRQAGPVLIGAGAIALALLPLAMALANRSAPLFAAIAAGLFAAGAALERRTDPRALLGALLREPLGGALLAFLTLCLVSLAWSLVPGLSLKLFGEFAVSLVASWLLVRTAPGRIPGWALPMACAMLLVAGLFVLASLVSGMAPQRALGQRDASFVLNRPTLTLLLLSAPLAALLVARGWRISAAALLLVTGLAVLRSDSESGALGLVVGAATYLVARLAPKRLSLALAAIGLGLGLALSPIEGDLLARFLPDAVHERLSHSSSQARVAIARGFGAVVAQAPVIGTGFGTSGGLAQAPAMQVLEPEMLRMIEFGHPHNAFLQVWVELGLLGAVLGGLVLFLALRSLAVLPRADFALGLALIAGAASIAFVGHGAWQGWWIAALGAAITWLREGWAARPPPASPRSDNGRTA